MKLSVVIVNYNVEHFLEQCLNSCLAATKEINSEIFVVDNNSVDGSIEMLKEKFPTIKLIENKDNVGFSKANNQAMRIAKGEYILLLNPDTIVEEDTFTKCIEYMDANKNAGGLGVKMIDGKGQFLPESKRGLPTPMVAFYKIFGLSKLFPKSKRFGKYHLGYLNDDETHEIEILSGAYMFMRSSVLDEIGLLDEDYFMYGEDIDLSYRIIKSGSKNIYFPETRIIHYKGESTKKSSINYVFVFYNAMIIFAKKHFSQKNAKTFSFLINLAIYFRAFIAICNRFIKKSIVPILDFSLVTAGLYILIEIYSSYSGIIYDWNVVKWSMLAYSFVWLFTVFLVGGYDKPIKLPKMLVGLLTGTIIILACYALLPKSIQFSRVIIILGFLSTAVILILFRIVLHIMGSDRFSLNRQVNSEFGIVGFKEESERIASLLNQISTNHKVITLISPGQEKKEGYSGTVQQLKEIIAVKKLDEVIFCAKDISTQHIIESMAKLESLNIEFKIAQPESLFLIGSNSIHTAGDLYMMNINAITNDKNKRLKRVLDISVSLVSLSLSPILIWIQKNKIGFITNSASVLIGKKTWVGFDSDFTENIQLPSIKSGVLSPTSSTETVLSPDKKAQINIIYAKDYNPSTDLSLIISGLRQLGS